MVDLPISDDDDETGNERQILADSPVSGKLGSKKLEIQSNITGQKESIPEDLPDCILKCKSIFKCRICPRIICLNEESLRAHLKSKVRCLSLLKIKSAFTIPNPTVALTTLILAIFENKIFNCDSVDVNILLFFLPDL